MNQILSLWKVIKRGDKDVNSFLKCLCEHMSITPPFEHGNFTVLFNNLSLFCVLSYTPPFCCSIQNQKDTSILLILFKEKLESQDWLGFAALI